MAHIFIPAQAGIQKNACTEIDPNFRWDEVD